MRKGSKKETPPDPAPETPRGGVPEDVPSPADEDCLEERPSDSLTVEPLRHKEKGDVPVWGHGEHSGQSAPQKGAKHL